MQLDLRELEDGRVFEADVCVVGAGPAGITIARELIGTTLKVVLLESGGTGWEDDIQSLYDGQLAGDEYLPLDSCRSRFLGGSTDHWAGMSFPLQEIDFQERPWIPHSGWPITRAALQPYYERAQVLCQLGPFVYSTEAVAGAGLDPDDIDETKILSRYYRLSPPTRFADVYGPELAAAPNVTLVLHATLARLVAAESGRAVTHAELHDTSGKTGTVRARHFVLACGGLENPRILLLSDAASPNGLSNSNDVVGRFFMDHPEPVVAEIAARDPVDVGARYGYISVKGQTLQHLWALPPSTQAERQLLNAAATIEPRYVQTGDDNDYTNLEDHTGGYKQTGVYNLRALIRSASQGRWPTDLKRKVLRIATDLDGAGAGAYQRLRTGHWPEPERPGVVIRIEPEPLPESRVTLGEERDMLGQRKMRLEWHRGTRGPKTLRTLCEIMGSEIGRLDLGRLQMQPWLLEENPSWPDRTIVGVHHMGTTRMSADPAKGVVNADCRSHEVENLFVAGSSVFPTCGFNNPTLTLVALALRTADHIRRLNI
jgi:choline dehydrogenase-like flavoprotein